MRKLPLSAVMAATLIAAPVIGAQPAAAQGGNPLNSIFSCGASGNKQAGGAAVGAVVGGILGNKVAGRNSRGAGTILGAALGAATGSYLGCRMQTSDQAKAEAAAQQAMENGRSTTWENPETGASGRTTVISSSPYDGARAQPVSLSGVRFASGVVPQGPYYGGGGAYEAPGRVNLRGSPTTNAAVVGRLQAGETFEAMAKVRGAQSDWLLVGRDGLAVGYVSEQVVRPLDQPVYVDNRGNGGRPMCRTFDQTITAGGQSETNRYTACQTASGEWVVQS